MQFRNLVWRKMVRRWHHFGINAVKSENLVAVRYLREIPLFKYIEQQITVERLTSGDLLLNEFMEVNFSKLINSTQICSNEFVCINYHFCKF